MKISGQSCAFELGNKELFGHPKIVHCPYEVNWHLVMENGSLTPICSLSDRSLSQSLTTYKIKLLICIFVLALIVASNY